VSDTRRQWRIPKYFAASAILVLATVIGFGITIAIQDHHDRRLVAEIEHAEAELREVSGRIASIKDSNLTTMDDYIAAYAQVEPLEKEYDEKLQKFRDLYGVARERESDPRILGVHRLHGKHHPETWQRMAEIIDLVHQINEITKRETSVVHAMASLPAAERLRFWHDQFMPLSAQEHALRERLRILGQGLPPDPETH